MIEYAVLTKKGNRDHNEDNVMVHCEEECGCFALADGLGGHGKGEVASKIAVETFESMDSKTYSMSPYFFHNAFTTVQQKILTAQKENKECSDMKTTLVALIMNRRQCSWAHIGDSRLYYFEKNHLKERTLDHSVPQMLASTGEIKENEIRNHPDRNRLLHVLGDEQEEDEEEIMCTEHEPITRVGKQAFLLCSDGFWELIEDAQMEALLKTAESPEQWLTEMEKIVLEHGNGRNMDNYSALAVWSDESGKKGFPWRLPWK